MRGQGEGGRRPFSRSEVMNASFRKRNATAPAETGQGAKVNRNSAAKTEPVQARI